MIRGLLRLGIVCACHVVWIAQGEETNTTTATKPFVVMAYNVENLMAVDRVAPYDEYAEVPDDTNS